MTPDTRDPVTPLTAAMKRLLDASAALRDRTDYRDIERLQGELRQAWADVREVERDIGERAVRAAHASLDAALVRNDGDHPLRIARDLGDDRSQAERTADRAKWDARPARAPRGAL